MQLPDAAQKRVMEELTELESKLSKLKYFIEESPIFLTLSYTQQQLLVLQRGSMDQYAHILRVRLTMWNA